MSRQLSVVDRAIGYLDQGIRLVFGPPPTANRPNPADKIPETELSASAHDLARRLMRIDHSGEVCAQALYQGQALAARERSIRATLEQAAQEENDHLAWTAERLRELSAHPSYMNFLWYAGSFAIGAAAGLAGDRWSLGFLAETERQVVEHLEGHLTRLPVEDQKSRAIIEQMRDDEDHHATTAMQVGGTELPEVAKAAMRLVAKVMTRTSYWF